MDLDNKLVVSSEETEVGWGKRYKINKLQGYIA